MLAALNPYYESATDLLRVQENCPGPGNFHPRATGIFYGQRGGGNGQPVGVAGKVGDGPDVQVGRAVNVAKAVGEGPGVRVGRDVRVARGVGLRNVSLVGVTVGWEVGPAGVPVAVTFGAVPAEVDRAVPVRVGVGLAVGTGGRAAVPVGRGTPAWRKACHWALSTEAIWAA